MHKIQAFLSPVVWAPFSDLFFCELNLQRSDRLQDSMQPPRVPNKYTFHFKPDICVSDAVTIPQEYVTLLPPKKGKRTSRVKMEDLSVKLSAQQQEAASLVLSIYNGLIKFIHWYNTTACTDTPVMLHDLANATPHVRYHKKSLKWGHFALWTTYDGREVMLIPRLDSDQHPGQHGE